MVAYNKYDTFVLDLLQGSHNFTTTTGHVYKVALSNTTPNVATNKLLGDITELTTSGGYTAGGATTTLTTTSSGTNPATGNVAGTNPATWTGSGGGFTFRYAALYDSTQTTPNHPLVAYWDYGSSQLVAAGETLQVQFSAQIFTIV